MHLQHLVSIIYQNQQQLRAALVVLEALSGKELGLNPDDQSNTNKHDRPRSGDID